MSREPPRDGLNCCMPTMVRAYLARLVLEPPGLGSEPLSSLAVAGPLVEQLSALHE